MARDGILHITVLAKLGGHRLTLRIYPDGRYVGLGYDTRNSGRNAA